MILFVQEEIALDTKEYSLGAKHYHYLIRVRRKKLGDEITLHDSAGKVFKLKISKVTAAKITCEILAFDLPPKEKKLKLNLLYGIPKGDKIDRVIRQATELGVAEIYPLLLDRSIVRLDSAKAKKKRERWQKIAKSAAEQSARLAVPKIHLPQTLKEALPLQKLCFAAYELEEEQDIKSYLEGLGDFLEISFIIGPEGGLSLEEVEYLQSRQVDLVSLGPNILRTETAPIAVLSMLMYHQGFK